MKEKEKISIDNIDIWLKDYFSLPENQKKTKQACERYDRLMVNNIRQQIFSGKDQFNLMQIASDDPGKRLEKVSYETLSSVEYQGKQGKLRINLLNQTAEFLSLDMQ